MNDLLANGFKTRQTDIRPANSINTAFQLVAVIFQLQSLQQFGGVACNCLDWVMVPYVKKSFAKHYKDGMKYIIKKEWICDGTMGLSDERYKVNENVYEYAMELTERELKQSVEALYHNLVSLQSRSGCQLPFSSINYGTCTSIEGRMVIKALLEGSINGVGKYHRTPIFPCGIFQLMSGVNRKEGDPNYDLFKLALKSTSQRLYPNYVNCDWSGNAGYDKNDPRTYMSTMGCRTANGWDINGFGQLKDGRGNICPVTIIMPTLAMQAKETALKQFEEGDKSKDFKELHINCFKKLLDKKIGEAKDMLIERFNWIASQSPKAASFMYENNVMAGYIPEEGIISALRHGTLALGSLGLAETLQILIGNDHTSEEGMELAKDIYKLFSKRCKEYKEKYKLNFGVYNTPKKVGLLKSDFK
jgi:ribonucleoside-triphosphate reductase